MNTPTETEAIITSRTITVAIRELSKTKSTEGSTIRGETVATTTGSDTDDGIDDAVGMTTVEVSVGIVVLESSTRNNINNNNKYNNNNNNNLSWYY